MDCRHRIFLLLFDDPKIFTDISAPLCCDVCHVARDGPGGFHLLGTPIEHALACETNQIWRDKWVPESDISVPSKAKLLPPVNKRRLQILVEDIHTWRRDLTFSDVNIFRLHESHYLGDDAIEKIRNKIHSIETEEALREILRSVKYKFPACFMSEHIPSLFQCIQQSLQRSQHLQHPSGYHRRARIITPSSPDPSEVQPPPTLPFLTIIASIILRMK